MCFVSSYIWSLTFRVHCTQSNDFRRLLSATFSCLPAADFNLANVHLAIHLVEEGDSAVTLPRISRLSSSPSVSFSKVRISDVISSSERIGSGL